MVLEQSGEAEQYRNVEGMFLHRAFVERVLVCCLHCLLPWVIDVSEAFFRNSVKGALVGLCAPSPVSAVMEGAGSVQRGQAGIFPLPELPGECDVQG